MRESIVEPLAAGKKSNCSECFGAFLSHSCQKQIVLQNSALTHTKLHCFHRHSVLFFRMRDRFLCRCSTEESVFSSNVGQYRNPQLECKINSSVQAERRSQCFPKNSCNLRTHKPSIVDSHQTGVRASSAVPGFSDWCSGAPPPSLRVLSGTIFSGAVPLTRWARLSRVTLTYHGESYE